MLDAAMNNYGVRVVNAISKRLLHASKYVHQNFRSPALEKEQQVLFVFGCQRSGTTLLQQIFDQDFNTQVYDEFDRRVYVRVPASKSSGKTTDFRLKPLDEVKREVARQRAQLIVIKPIVETQNALKLLRFFPGSRGLFIYRHYGAVAASNLKLFGRMNGINDLRPIAKGESSDWRAEGVAPEVRSLVAARFHEGMEPYDAAALFWYVRNRHYFDLGLHAHPAVRLLKYEDLVRDPAGMIAGMYRFLGAAAPQAASSLVRDESSGKGRAVPLSPDVERLCGELLERLDLARGAAAPAS